LTDSQIYLYSAFHNTDCIKAASQNQSRQHNSVCLFMKKRQSSLAELINGMMGHLIWISSTEQAKDNSGKEPKNSVINSKNSDRVKKEITLIAELW